MYGKFFASTFTGSMFGAGTDVFAVWGYVIAHAVNGKVELNPKALSAALGTTPKRIVEAITYLCAKDAESRNPDLEGRRLVLEGRFQYSVTSHAIYRSMNTEEDRREYNRIKQQQSRARKRAVKELPPMVNPSNLASMTSQQSVTYTEANTEADTYTKADQDNARVLTADLPKPSENNHSKPTNLINGSEVRRHGSHAWCSWPKRDGLCVPAFLHREFLSKSRKTADELKAWYVETVARHDQHAIGDDALDFWRNEFGAWIGLATTKPKSLTPLQRTIAKNKAAQA